MSSRTSDHGERASSDGEWTAVPEVLEWLLAVFLALGGLAAALGGSAILWAGSEDRIATAIAEGVAEGTVRSDVLTPEQLTEVVTHAIFWLGIGLVVTGLATVVVAITYLIARRRARGSSGDRSDRERLLSHALLGAVATGLLSFIPASPILGGAIAGYVQEKEATGVTKVGAVSGLLAALPLAVITTFLTVGLLSGFAAAGVGGLGGIVALSMVIVVLLSTVYFVGLSAVGGYLAGVVASDGRGPDDTTLDGDSSH